MKKKYYLSLLTSGIIFAQNSKEIRQTQGFYFQPEIHVGLNLANIIKNNENKRNDAYYQYKSYDYPKDFSYGISAVAGFNFIPNLSLGGGLKYTYVSDNFHVVYVIIQPKILFNFDDDPAFIDLTYGFQVNKAMIEDSNFWNVKIGKQISYSKRLSQQGGLYFEAVKLGKDGFPFVGFFYGITLFSNKNYNSYGKNTN